MHNLRAAAGALDNDGFMTSDFPLRSSMNGLQAKMITDFREVTAEIEHRGSKGREREALIAKDYLTYYLPANVNLVHGAEIVDSLGNRSAECDLVIEDISTPPLMLTKTFRLIPVEWAHGIIEVKSNLNSDELLDSQRKITRAKGLKKLTYVPQTGDIRWNYNFYGKSYEYFPMYGMVFAYSSMNLSELASKLWEIQTDIPMELWVDSVVVLDKGLLMYAHPEAGNLFRPQAGCYLQAISSEEALVPLTLVLQNAFLGIRMEMAKIAPYMGPDTWGSVISRVGP